MESRKIVKSGNTSFVLSLPIDWIRKNNLKQGSMVKLSENELGDIVVSSGKSEGAPKKDFVTIKVDNKDEDSIYLELMTAYVRDASTIIFEGKELVSKDTKIVDFVKTLIGLDVMERSTTSIIVKNFFTLDKEVSPEVLLRKMDIVNRAGMETLNQYFRKGFANEDFFELQKLNDQNSRLFILFRKCVLKLLEKPALMNALKTNHLQLMKDRLYAQALTQVSDSLLIIGRSFQIMDVDQTAFTALKNHFNILNRSYKSMVSAVNNKIHEEISKLIIESASERKRLEKDLKMLNDPLAVQVTSSLLDIYYDLQVMAYEELA